MQKSINNSKFDRMPSSNLINSSILNNSINTSRIQLDHHYQKHQPQTQTHAGKLAPLTKSDSSSQSNYILTNQQSTLLKKHVYTNNDPLNLFHLPEQGNHHLSDNNPQVITYEQAKSEQQMLNYYSKALMLTIVVGVVMFALNISIFIILMGKNRKIKKDERQKQTENDEQSQKQLQSQQTVDHHLKMINNEELVQYDDYLEVNYN